MKDFQLIELPDGFIAFKPDESIFIGMSAQQYTAATTIQLETLTEMMGSLPIDKDTLRELMEHHLVI